MAFKRRGRAGRKRRRRQTKKTAKRFIWKRGGIRL